MAHHDLLRVSEPTLFLVLILADRRNRVHHRGLDRCNHCRQDEDEKEHYVRLVHRGGRDVADWYDQEDSKGDIDAAQPRKHRERLTRSHTLDDEHIARPPRVRGPRVLARVGHEGRLEVSQADDRPKTACKV